MIYHSAPEAFAQVPPSADLDACYSRQLGARTTADYDALRNDLEQAKEIAADFQRMVAGKSNELAEMRQVLERTTADLARLEESIVRMRQERHELANRAMVASALEIQKGKLAAECARLKGENEALQLATTAAVEGSQGTIRRLELENSRLLTQLEGMRLKAERQGQTRADVSHACESTSGPSLARVLAAVEEVRDLIKNQTLKEDLSSIEVLFSR